MRRRPAAPLSRSSASASSAAARRASRRSTRSWSTSPWPRTSAMADGGAQADGTIALGGERLPPGRHGLPRAVVAENQRERLLNGGVEAVAEHGYNATTISRITAAAKISRRTFYEYFEGKEDCFAAAYEMIGPPALAWMLAAPGAGEPWPDGVRARLAALLD